MFSFRSRKAQQDLQQFLLRVINRNGLAPAKALENNRHESRVNLKLGMWVIPLSDGFADIDSAFTGAHRGLQFRRSLDRDESGVLGGGSPASHASRFESETRPSNRLQSLEPGLRLGRL